MRDNSAERRVFSRAMSADHAAQPWITDMLDADLEAGDVFFDLFDEGQVLRQLRQAIVWLDLRLIDRRRAGGDENRIELVVLGADAPAHRL